MNKFTPGDIVFNKPDRHIFEEGVTITKANETHYFYKHPGDSSLYTIPKEDLEENVRVVWRDGSPFFPELEHILH